MLVRPALSPRTDVARAHDKPGGWRPWIVCVALAVVTVAAFWPARRASFINFDDFVYVTENPFVGRGLSWANLVDAVSSRELELYHPLSIVSLMVDHELFEFWAPGYHLENVAIHVANVLLVFAFLQGATGAPWRSAAAAMVFGVHPLRVESVLWVSERKDVLCLLFGLLAMVSYLGYCRRPSLWKMLGCAVLYALSLLSKPSLVTLPFVLLLVDYWPLGRVRGRVAGGGDGRFFVRPWWGLIAEKWLLLALTVGSIFLTRPDFFAIDNVQSPTAAGVSSAGASSAGVSSAGVSSAGVSSAGASSAGVSSAGVSSGGVSSGGGGAAAGAWLAMVQTPALGESIGAAGESGRATTAGQMPATQGSAVPTSSAQASSAQPPLADYELYKDVSWRSQNAVVSYVRYLEKMVDFHRLAAFYPSRRWSMIQVTGAAGILAVITVFALAQMRRRPWLFTGWFWYVGSLLPMIGIVVISDYSLADRYTYFPMIGIVIAVIWSIPQSWGESRAGRWSLAGVGAGVAIVLSLCSYTQAKYWENSQTLWGHAVAVTENNWLAHDLYGTSLAFGTPPELERGLAELREAERIAPADSNPPFRCAVALVRLGRRDEAIAEYRKTVALNPGNAVASEDLAILYGEKGAYAQALAAADAALALEPNSSKVKLLRGVALTGLKRTAEAAAQLREVGGGSQASADYQNQLGLALLRTGSVADAILCFSNAVDLRPKEAKYRKNLADARAIGLKAERPTTLPISGPASGDSAHGGGDGPAGSAGPIIGE